MEEIKIGKIAGKRAPDDYSDDDILYKILEIITEEKENENKMETAKKIFDCFHDELRARIALRLGERIFSIEEIGEDLKKKIAEVVLTFVYGDKPFVFNGKKEN